MALEQAASQTAKIASVVSFLPRALEGNLSVTHVLLAHTQIRPVALHRQRHAESALLDSSTATQDCVPFQHAKNARWDSRHCLEPPINPSALFSVNPVLGLRPASPRARLAQLALTIRTRAPPASHSASLALLVIIRHSPDKVHALLALLERGAAMLVPNVRLLANHALLGRTILLRDHLV